jgi:hypothetical protein
MLSKCLNPHCTARFRYLGEGRLFRIDFSEASRRRKALFGAPLKLETERPIEHFWLCETCAPKMTVQLSEAGEVRLVSQNVEGAAPADTLYPMVPQAS